VCSRPIAPAAGPDTGSAPPIAAATASAFSVPDTSSQTSRDRWIAGSVKVIRCGGGFGESSTLTTSRVVSRTAGLSGNKELMWPSGPTPSRWTSKFGAGSPGSAISSEELLVGQCGGRQVVAEFAVAGRHRVHVAGRDVDVVQQRLTGLLLVAFVVIFGDVSLVAPEQMDLGPIDPSGLRTEVAHQAVAVAAAGQHDQRSSARGNGGIDDADQSLARRGDQPVAVGERLDGAHAYSTRSMPSSAEK